MCRLVQVSGALLAARKEAEEKERLRREQLEQQHAVQAALAQRQKVSLTHYLYLVFITCNSLIGYRGLKLVFTVFIHRQRGSSRQDKWPRTGRKISPVGTSCLPAIPPLVGMGLKTVEVKE